MIKQVELTKNCAFMIRNFEGYKLSLELLPATKESLTIAPLKAKPSEEQYSYLHAELFSLHNYLIHDQWNQTDSYFINEQNEIIKCSYVEKAEEPNNACTVFKLDSLSNRERGDYPVSIKFISNELCIICNGIDEIMLVNTNDRSKNFEWKEIFIHKTSEYRGLIIKDSRLDIANNEKLVSCLLQHVRNTEEGCINDLLHCTMSYNLETNKWEFCIKNTLTGKGGLNYCAFDYGSKALIISSNKDYKFKVDTSDQSEDTSKSSKKGEDSTEKHIYSWSQFGSDITIKFKKEAVSKEDLKVVSTKKKLTVWSSGKIIFEGDLFENVDPDFTTWTWENDFLEISLQVENETVHWPYLVENGPLETIEEKMPGIEHPIPSQPITNLESQIEDCDFPTSLNEEFSIVRFDLDNLQCTHKIRLDSNPLFTTYINPGTPPAIVTREDVDGCVWQIQENLADPDQWCMHHEGSLPAFGYVQASKQQKKFVNCSPNLQYSVICESYRHIFIYKTNYDNDLELRDRFHSRVTVGKQHVVTLEDSDEILGMSVSNNFIILLTNKSIVYLKIN